MSFWDKWGMLNSKYGEIGCENALLYTYEYHLLTGELTSFTGGLCLNSCNADFSYITDHPYTIQKASHDQITAICCYSYRHGLDWHKRIYSNIKWFKFMDKWVHPRDIIYYKLLVDGKLNCFLKLLLIIFMDISFSTEKTNGELMYWIRAQTFKEDWLYREWFDMAYEKYGPNPLAKIFEIYFPDKNHPINEFLRGG